MIQELNTCHTVNQASQGDVVSIAMMARDLVRAGVKLDEGSLNQEILRGLLSNADVNKPESLRALCRELVEQGYAPRAVVEENRLDLNPIRITPSVQGQMPGKGWAFIWELDRDCENFGWLIGAHITVDGRLYTVQGIDNMPQTPRIGDRLTLLCSSVSGDEH
ncbi:MAG: hypothetical protein ACI4VB_11130 [Bradymonadia bacterium]